METIGNGASGISRGCHKYNGLFKSVVGDDPGQKSGSEIFKGQGWAVKQFEN